MSLGVIVIVKAKYKGYCYKCYSTIWQGEFVELTGKARHIDCVKALKDPTPRKIQPAYIKTVGKVSKKKMVEILTTR